MTPDSQGSSQLQALLDRLQAGEDTVRAALLQHTLERFRQLARRMFRQYPDLRMLDETDDVVQKALVRLHRVLGQIHPPNGAAYFSLAAQQVRWVLRDLAREMATAKAVGYTDTLPDEQEKGGEPGTLLEWGDFHDRIDRLPGDTKEVFHLVFYSGLTQPEASEVLKVPLRTVKRRWQQAKLLLREALRNEWPSLEDGR